MAAWSPDYIDTLMELLETVKTVVRSMERDRNQMQAGVRSV